MNPNLVMLKPELQAVILAATTAGQRDRFNHFPEEGHNPFAIAMRGYDRCMAFFAENEDTYWMGTAGWWNRDFLYLFLVTYAQQWG